MPDTFLLDTPIIFADTPKRSIFNVEVFKGGIQTDSRGFQKEYTSSELDAMIASFNKGLPEIVPLKLGHSTPEHTQRIASELGLTPAILMGEDGRGAAALGKAVKLFRSNGSIRADLEAPDQVAGLIKNGYLTGVSSEIIRDYKGQGPVISGLALLGAERPAVKGMESLDGVTVLADGTKPDHVYSWSLSTSQ